MKTRRQILASGAAFAISQTAPLFASACLQPYSLTPSGPAGEVTSFTLTPTETFERKLASDPSLDWDELRHAYDLWRNCDDVRGRCATAALHGYYCDTEDVHKSWAFLPWHRAFLYFHERILAKLIGRPAFRLPVWAWEADRAVPLPFRTAPGSPLTGIGKHSKLEMVSYGASTRDVQGWLVSSLFSDFVGERDHPGRSAGGPHSAVHMNVKGDLFDLKVAARDPLFYALHANVDRCWDFWTDFYRYPLDDSHWLDQTFDFYDENCHRVQVKAGQFRTLEGLGYRYGAKPAIELYAPDVLPLDFADGVVTFPAPIQQWISGMASRYSAGRLASAGSAALNRAIYLDITVAGNQLEAGKHYLVGITQAGGSGSPVPFGRIFAFASPSHHHHEMRAALHLHPNAVLAFLQANRSGNQWKARLSYAQPQPNGRGRKWAPLLLSRAALLVKPGDLSL